MDQTFFVRKSIRKFGLFSVGFFSLMMLLPLIMAWAVPNERDMSFVAVLVTFWGLWLCAAIYSLANFRRRRLRVTDYRVSIQDVFTSREVELADITALYWRVTSGAVIRLDSADTRISVDLNYFERPERLQLVEFFRMRIREEIQHGWKMFCYKVALPLSVAPAGTSVREKLKEPGAVLITRRRWDWYLLPVVAALTIGGGFAAWKLGQPRWMAAGVQAALLWLLLRFVTPKEGMVSQSMLKTPGHSNYCLFMLGWGVVGIGGIFAFNALKAAIPHHVVVGTILMLLWYVGMIGRAYMEDQRRHQRDVENSVASELEWAMRYGEGQASKTSGNAGG